MNQMPPVTKNLLIINILFFLAAFVLPRHGIDLDGLLGLHFFLADDFRFYQFFTSMFLHADLEHIFFNMFALWMFGRIVEQTLGQKRFLMLFLISGVGAGLIQELAQYIYFYQYEIVDHFRDITGQLHVGKFFDTEDGMLDLNRICTIGASGGVYGVLIAFGMLYPNDRMYVIPIPVPIKAKYLITVYIIIEIMSTWMPRPHDNVAHVAHLGGALFAAIMIIYWKNMDRRNNRWGGGYYGPSF